MTDPRPPGVGEDAAWAIVSARLPPSDVLSLLDDPERLLRVNSQWVFETWERPTLDRFRLCIENLSNNRIWETSGTIRSLPDGLRLDYDEGIKAFTRFLVEPAGSANSVEETLKGLARTDSSWPIPDYPTGPKPGATKFYTGERQTTPCMSALGRLLSFAEGGTRGVRKLYSGMPWTTPRRSASGRLLS